MDSYILVQIFDMLSQGLVMHIIMYVHTKMKSSAIGSQAIFRMHVHGAQMHLFNKFVFYRVVI